MKREYRVTKSTQFQKVKKEGCSWAHPLLVLCALANGLGYSRFGFSASRRLGKAVKRNRSKRLIREAVRLRLETIVGGWDLVFIARGPIQEANFYQVDRAVEQLLRRAHVLKTTSSPSPSLASNVERGDTGP